MLDKGAGDVLVPIGAFDVGDEDVPNSDRERVLRFMAAMRA